MTISLRRLEQENDDLANEYIDTKITLSKQLEDTKDDYEMTRAELNKYKTDYQNKLNESLDTNKKLMSELEQLKQLWRKQSDKYESQIERNGVIITEYKQICNTLSNKVEKWTSFKKKYKTRNTKLALCDKCSENNKESEDLNLSLSAIDNDDEHDKNSISTSSSRSLESSDSNDNLNQKPTDSTSNNLKDQQAFNKIKHLELELARVKLELVDAQCKNQEFDHKLKGYTSTNSNASKENIAMSPVQNIKSNSTVSQSSNLFEGPMSVSATSLSKHGSVGSNSSLYSGINQGNSNNWLSKTFTHFKEATNQVVQKVKNNNEIN